MAVEHHDGVGFAHIRPPLEGRVVAVEGGPHQASGCRRASCGRGWSPPRRCRRSGWKSTAFHHVRLGGDVPVDGVGRHRPPGEALAGRDVAVLVVGQQDLACAGQLGRPVLGLAVGAHDPLVAADADVVLGRHPARVLEGLLAGEDHGAVRRHDQDPAGVHQHGRFRVPVRLGADVDAGHDHVDLAPALGELDQAPEDPRHPVHVFGAAVHGDLGARRQREPLDRRTEAGGEVEGGEDPPAFRLGDRSQTPWSDRP